MEKISLKEFWEKLEKRIAGYSADELRSILRAMAEEMLPQQRQIFIDKLKPRKESADATQRLIRQDELLSDIDDFVSELSESFKNPEPYRDDYYYDEYDSDEDDGWNPYEEFIEPLSVFFGPTPRLIMATFLLRATPIKNCLKRQRWKTSMGAASMWRICLT